MPLRARTARRLAAALVTALFLAAAPAANAANRPFAPDSYLNKPLAPTAGIDAKSRVMVNQLVSEVRRKGATLSHDCWTTPVWTVKRRRRKVRVRTDRDRPALARQWKRVPLPRKATAACGN